TSAIMSDDLAVNADVVTGTPADRELPIVKKIFWGSLLNKVYCIVGVLVLMSVYPPILKGILVLGGLYLCFEGAHKVIEKLFHKNEEHKSAVMVSEKDRINGAIKTDLVLSVEIIVIAKESLSGSFLNQTIALILVGLGASILIYGLVALLVKIDDLGLYLVKNQFKKTGLALVKAMPIIMKGLGIFGTVAMFLVGGGILAHTFHIPHLAPELIQNSLIGLIAGALMVIPLEAYQKIKAKTPA
ncbi:MAG: DUF808 family protein, partial [Bdellovibrio sp.]